MTHIKLLIILILLIFTSYLTQAQRYTQVSKFRISLGVAAGSKVNYNEDLADPGIGLGFTGGMEYVFHQNFSVAASFTQFLTRSNVVTSVNYINLDGRYYFVSERSDTKLYGLLGYARFGKNTIGDGRGSESGLNIGLGINHALNRDWGINGQIKYQTPGEAQFVASVGIIRSL